MEDRRFDSLVKSLAAGASRRSVLKGMLGLGAAAMAKGHLWQSSAAARRPTPTPRPLTCPGIQVARAGQCACPDGLATCGPDCCNDDPSLAGTAGYSECCDNACCFGTCYGEELCCPTNNQGTRPPLAEFCPSTGECCFSPNLCCTIDGCCDTFCWGGELDDASCCAQEQVCAGSGTSADRCCTDGTVCCGGGTEANVCVGEGGCCDDSECGSCQICDPTLHICQSICAAEEICCEGSAGSVCVAGTSCPEACTIHEDCPTYPCQACFNGICTFVIDGCTAGDICCDSGTNVSGIACVSADECSPPCSAYFDCFATCQICNTDVGVCTGGCEADELCCGTLENQPNVCIPGLSECPAPCDSNDDCGPCQLCSFGIGCADFCSPGQICCGDGLSLSSCFDGTVCPE